MTAEEITSCPPRPTQLLLVSLKRWFLRLLHFCRNCPPTGWLEPLSGPRQSARSLPPVGLGCVAIGAAGHYEKQHRLRHAYTAGQDQICDWPFQSAQFSPLQPGRGCLNQSMSFSCVTLAFLRRCC